MNAMNNDYAEEPEKCQGILPEQSDICIDTGIFSRGVRPDLATTLYRPPDLLHNPAFADGSLRPPHHAAAGMVRKPGW